MEKTRFSQLTQSELELLYHSIASNFESPHNYYIDNKENLIKIGEEVKNQMQINAWNKSQFETKKRIQQLEKELIDLKKLLK